MADAEVGGPMRSDCEVKLVTQSTSSLCGVPVSLLVLSLLNRNGVVGRLQECPEVSENFQVLHISVDEESRCVGYPRPCSS